MDLVSNFKTRQTGRRHVLVELVQLPATPIHDLPFLQRR